MLWAALIGVIALQVVAVQWPPAQTLFGTQPLNFSNWVPGAAVASSILLLEESRKLMVLIVKKLFMEKKIPCTAGKSQNQYLPY